MTATPIRFSPRGGTAHMTTPSPLRTQVCPECWASLMRGDTDAPRPPAAYPPAAFTPRCRIPPEIAVAFSKRIAAAIAGRSLTRGAADAPNAAMNHSAQPGGPSSKSAGKSAAKAAAQAASTASMQCTTAEGVPCPEFGDGWRRVSRRRASSAVLDHTWYSPDGIKFTSRVRVMRHLQVGAQSFVARVPPAHAH